MDLDIEYSGYEPEDVEKCRIIIKKYGFPISDDKMDSMSDNEFSTLKRGVYCIIALYYSKTEIKKDTDIENFFRNIGKQFSENEIKRIFMEMTEILHYVQAKNL